MTNGSPGRGVDGVETGGRDLIAPRVMDPDGSDKADDLPPIPNPCLTLIPNCTSLFRSRHLATLDDTFY